MKKRVLHVGLLVVCLLFSFKTSILAQEEESDEETMSQGQLAIVLAQRLGLAPDAPGLTEIAAINMLLQIGIVPRDGWNAGSEVTLGMLAGVLVQALGLDVDNPQDDASLVEACRAAGIDFSSVGNALASAGGITLNPSTRRTQPAASQANDPLLRLPPGDPSTFFSGAGSGQGNGAGGFNPGGGGQGGGGGSFVPPGPPPMTPN
jgi:uncharacterized membrane protein YgcG